MVTVDGPGGTGKSTVSRAVAERLGLPHLDTGAFYRAATLAALEAGVDLDDPVAIEEVIRKRSFRQELGSMYLDDQDVSELIRGEAVTLNVSKVSAHASIRALLVDYQRRWVNEHDDRAVVEGRDIGTVVLPDATIKIYLDARPEVRAQRRASQSGEALEAVLEDLYRRDRLDSTRETSPLTVPEDAIVVDSSDMEFEEVVAHIADLARARVGLNSDRT